MPVDVGSAEAAEQCANMHKNHVCQGKLSTTSLRKSVIRQDIRSLEHIRIRTLEDLVMLEAVEGIYRIDLRCDFLPSSCALLVNSRLGCNASDCVHTLLDNLVSERHTMVSK